MIAAFIIGACLLLLAVVYVLAADGKARERKAEQAFEDREDDEDEDPYFEEFDGTPLPCDYDEEYDEENFL